MLTDIPSQAFKEHPWLPHGRWVLNMDRDWGLRPGVGFEFRLRYVLDKRLVEIPFRYGVNIPVHRHGRKIYASKNAKRHVLEVVNGWLWRVAPWASIGS